MRYHSAILRRSTYRKSVKPVHSPKRPARQAVQSNKDIVRVQGIRIFRIRIRIRISVCFLLPSCPFPLLCFRPSLRKTEKMHIDGVVLMVLMMCVAPNSSKLVVVVVIIIVPAKKRNAAYSVCPSMIPYTLFPAQT